MCCVFGRLPVNASAQSQDEADTGNRIRAFLSCGAETWVLRLISVLWTLGASKNGTSKLRFTFMQIQPDVISLRK
jgi:uncharacterized membrane protein YqjE